MKVLILKRVHLDESGTYGVLQEEGQPPFCVTIEKPWKDNQKSISCIPADEYQAIQVVKIKFGLTYELQNVPNRDGILLHKGNFIEHTHGCILLGENFDLATSVDGKSMRTGVMSTGPAFSEFIKLLNQENQFKLVIKEV